MLEGEQALDMLKQLDLRQELILRDIDDLNGRIEALLESFLASRDAKTELRLPSQVSPATHANGTKPVAKRAA